MVKYILVTGGVLSGIGKGVVASSVGRILKEMGFTITAIKIDPYINIDAGTMSPFEHGEVFVLDDGGEVDLDLGNYERFMDLTLTKHNNLTTGKIYNSVIEKERRGDYLGKTVQVVPHICDEIQDWIEKVAGIVPIPANTSTDNLQDLAEESASKNAKKQPDVCVIELGGTVGDIESMPFIEAMRQFQFRVGRDNFCNVHVSLVPVIGVVGEQKTKPTQQCVRDLRALGISPDIIVCRSEKELTDETKQKISSFCHVPTSHVIGVHNVSNTYNVPLLLQHQDFSDIITQRLKLADRIPNINGKNLSEWKMLAERCDNILKDKDCVKISVVGKYTGLTDAYLSIKKAIKHASIFCNKNVDVDWIDASALEPQHKGKEKHNNAWKSMHDADGILIPGGFGDRGTEGKVIAANYARENKIPFLGICLGFQLAVIEYARNVLGNKYAISQESLSHSNMNMIDFTTTNDNLPTPIESLHESVKDNLFIVFMPEISKTHMGGTMRLGSRKTYFKRKDCQLFDLYSNNTIIRERHRHRYEVNPQQVQTLENAGLHFVGIDETGNRQIMFELETKDHPYYVGTQFHPEFLSRPTKPSPPFVGLVQHSINQFNKKRNQNGQK